MGSQVDPGKKKGTFMTLAGEKAAQKASKQTNKKPVK